MRHTEHNQTRRRRGSGNTIIEFALVMVFLFPMFAGAFSIGMALAKGIQVSNVARDAVVLMVRANQDPTSGLDLSTTQNQRMIVKAAGGLNMNLNAQFDPDPSGKAVVILSKIILVGPTECSLGVIPAPSGVPNSTPPGFGWTSGNCANYGSYVFAYRVVIGNGTRWSSSFGTPPGANVKSDGTISAKDIATNSAVRASNFSTVTGMTLDPSVYGLVSEMYADVSFLNFFNILSNPTVIYARSIS